MNIDFELFGEITGAETIAIGPRFENCESCEPVLDMDAGEGGKGLPTCVNVVVRYVLPKCIGTKLTGLVK